MQIISDENNASCASSGQVVIIKSTLNPSSILPVELITFNGYNDGLVNVLNWSTASELNTLKFEVEKSLDAVNFSYIGEKAAAGNSNVTINYTLNDEHPVLGSNYYRLKMIDKDGQYEYSEIINIKVDDIPAANDGIIKVYPNPTTGQINIVYQAANSQKLNLDVFNVIGQSMFNKIYELNAGLHTLVLDAAEYAKGVYILNLQNNTAGSKNQTKFIKE
jgi:hypothetical protein